MKSPLKPLVWSGGPQEYTGQRGNWIVAKIICEDNIYTLYDQAEISEGLGKLTATVFSLDEAQQRAEYL